MVTGNEIVKYEVRDPLELNLSYMPFITQGGLFVPTKEKFALGDCVKIELQLPGQTEALLIEGKIIWITPLNALHHVLPGIGVQFIGENAKMVRTQIETRLDPTVEVGGYTCGITENRSKKTLA